MLIMCSTATAQSLPSFGGVGIAFIVVFQNWWAPSNGTVSPGEGVTLCRIVRFQNWSRPEVSNTQLSLNHFPTYSASPFPTLKQWAMSIEVAFPFPIAIQ